MSSIQFKYIINFWNKNILEKGRRIDYKKYLNEKNYNSYNCFRANNFHYYNSEYE
ncbi:hypothetical protein MARI151_40001 [Maribacter litoralis]|uniref:Uncharacterized protein n=1 Tax=Maribacter litoralis TaxID=2059726 RepID=A0A653TQ92_9FLAO|nr:hypothetical protein MARI151_40001 [Maribacter litoralis]